MQVDWTVGEILRALDEAGIAENTLIIFTTDNGCSPQAKFEELAAAGHFPSYIYRGHKADIYEGGHRVPFLARWPGKIKAGSKSDALVSQVDFFATAAEIVGAETPDDRSEDSISFLPLLTGEAESIRDSIITQSIDGSFSIRDGNWKLVFCPGSGGWSEPRPGKVDLEKFPAMQLFDLAADPGEEFNLYDENEDRVAEMTAAMQKAIDEGRTTPGPKLENDVPVELVKTFVSRKKPKAK